MKMIKITLGGSLSARGYADHLNYGRPGRRVLHWWSRQKVGSVISEIYEEKLACSLATRHRRFWVEWWCRAARTLLLNAGICWAFAHELSALERGSESR